MSLTAFLKLLYESKVLMLAPGWAALVLLGYVEAFQLPPIRSEITGVTDAVTDLQIQAYEAKLDAVYAALCMNPGDPALLERIRELQQQYEKVAGKKYDPPTCDLLLKLR